MCSQRVMTPVFSVPLEHNTITTINCQTAAVALLKQAQPTLTLVHICTHNNNTVTALLPFTNSILLNLTMSSANTQNALKSRYQCETFICETYRRSNNSSIIWSKNSSWSNFVWASFSLSITSSPPIRLHMLHVSLIISNNFVPNRILLLELPTGAYGRYHFDLLLVSCGLRGEFI